MKKQEESVESLIKAILDLHGCKSKWINSVPIKEMFGDQIVWEGVVQVFELLGHQTAKKCYAWSHEIEGSTKRKFYAVLHDGPVDSPEKAVKASIVSKFKKNNNMQPLLFLLMCL